MSTGRNKRIDRDKPESPGRVAVDSRGRNVWQWNDDQLDSTTIMLQSLDNASLALEPTLNVRRSDIERAGKPGQEKSSASPEGRRDRKEETQDLNIEQSVNFKVGGGFDPYNRS